MSDITDVPNIGKELARNLKEVGIKNLNELKYLGSQKAFIKIKIIDKDACINMLYALEGAVQGIRWHNLSQEKKTELKDFYKFLCL